MQLSVSVHREKSLDYHRDSVFTLVRGALSTLLSAGGDGIVVSHPLTQNSEAKALLQAPMALYSLLYLPENQLLLAGQSDGTLYFIDLSDAKPNLLTAVKTHERGIFDLCLKPDEPGSFFSAGEDGSIALWNGTECRLKVPVSPSSLRSLLYLPDKKLLFSAGKAQNMYVHRWEASHPTLINEVQIHKGSVFRLTLTPDCEHLISVSRDAHIRLWKLNDLLTETRPEPVKEVVGHHYAINDCVFAPDGELFATASMDKTIKIWAGATFRLLKVIDYARNEGHRSSVNRLVWAEDLLYSVGDDTGYFGWKVKTELK